MPERRPRVALVATAWDEPGEASFLARRVGAALAMAASVDVVLADGGPAGETTDGAFRVLRVDSPRPDRCRAGLLALALEVGARSLPTASPAGAPGLGVPAGARARLRRLAGDGWPAVAPLLDRLAPDAVVVAGHRHQLAAELSGRATPYRRTLLALAVDDLALELSAGDGVLSGWDALLATSRAEADLLARVLGPAGRRAGASAGSPEVHDVGLALEDPGAALARDPAGGDAADGLGDVLAWCAGAQRMVVLDDPLRPEGSHQGLGGPGLSRRTDDHRGPLGPEVEYLAWRFPSLAMVVTHPGATTLVRGRSRRHAAALSRQARWRLTTGAAATVDLRPPRVLAVEVIESLLLATPAAAGWDSGAARRHLEEAGGGLWYRNRPELGAVVARLLDSAVGSRLGEQGRRWAAAAHGDRARFVRATSAAVLGRQSRPLP